MHPDDPRFEAYYARFEEVAEKAEQVPRSNQVSSAKYILTLFGDNGLDPEEELAFLEKIAQDPGPLKKVIVDFDYWQNIVLFIPEEAAQKV